MTPEEAQFKEWWARPIEELAPNAHNGFALLALSLPILERFLREKSGLGEERVLDNSFYNELRALLPDLSSNDIARRFWRAYRHGLLHQATFSLKADSGAATPSVWINPKQPEVVCHDPAKGSFTVNARKFSETVLATIRTEFSTFVGGASANHPLPEVRPPGSGGPPGSISGVA